MRIIYFVLVSCLLLAKDGFSQSGVKAIHFFVAPTGKDQNPGTIEKPFATLQRARDEVRKSPFKRNVTVFLRGGTYSVKESCVFSATDSGHRTSPITYRNYVNEKVVFHGGIKLNNKAFKKVTDPKILEQLPVETHANVVEINLKKAGITDFGKLSQHGFAIPVRPASLELFFDGKPLDRARWPNTGTVAIGEVKDPGSNFRMGDTTQRGAEFVFEEPRTNRWKQTENIWIAGFFSNSWSDDHLQVKTIDTFNHLMKLVQPHLYSVQSTSTDKDKIRGFYVYNLLEEIDRPGEWFVDEKTGIMYLWPPSHIQNQTIEVSLFSDPFIKLEKTANLKFEGMIFECSRGMAIHIKDSENCIISSSNFHNLGTVAISMGSELQGGKLSSNPDGSPKREDTNHHRNRHILIDRCTIYSVGTGGIILTGGDRGNLIAGNNMVQNCEIHHFSRINNTYSPAVDVYGIGNVVRNNYIHDAPHEALSFLGNNHRIEFNHFQRLCTTAHDMGAVYTGRDPSSRGTIIRGNFFEDIRTSIYGSVCAIYFDDGSGGIEVNQNIFYQSSSPGKYKYGAIFIHGGGGSSFSDNIFIDCEQAFGNTPWGDAKWKEYVTSPLLKKRMFTDVDIKSEPYRKSYPELASAVDSINLQPRINQSTRSLFYGKGTFSTGTSYQHKSIWITQKDPGFVNVSKMDFRLKPNAAVFKQLPNFKTVAFEKIGIQKPNTK